MTPDQKKIVTAIDYLTGGLVVPPGMVAVSDSATLERKLGIDTGTGPAYEETLVGLGVIAPMAGYYHTPRYSITDAGRTFIVMTKSFQRAWAPDDILARIPESIFAGNHLSIFNACVALVGAGLVTTADGEGTFTLV